MKQLTYYKDNPLPVNLIVVISLVILISSLVVMGHLTQKVKASPVVGFNAGRIIDDSIFTNTNSMGVGDVQNFLNSKVPLCDTWGTQPSEFGGGTRAQWGTAHNTPPPYTCLRDYTEGGLSAAQIIYNTAQQYQINPQVLVVLLQKEQGLVTDTWPLSSQYRTATGYGCPDSTPGVCDSSYYGFTNQLKWSGTMFHAIMNNSPTWYTPYILGTNYVQFNPDTACSGGNVYIQNRATQALYNYTPYQPNQGAIDAGWGTASCGAYGNRNFYLYFSSWFGPTIGTKILKKDSDPTYYIYSGGKKTPIPSYELFLAYGFDKIGVTITSAAYLDSLPTTAPLTRLSRYNNGAVQLVDNGYRYTVTSMDSCNNWGYSCADPNIVNTLDDDLFITKWIGLLQPLMYSSGGIYKMESGKKLPFLNMQAITENGYNFGQISTVSAGNAGQPLGPILPSEGVSLMLKNGVIAAYTKGQYIAIASLDLFYRWGLDKNYYSTLPPSSWDTQPPVTTSSLTDYYISLGDTKLLIDNGRKIDLSTSSSNWPSAATANPYAGSLLDHLSFTSANPQTCFRSSNGDIFVVEDSQRRSIRLVDDIYRLGCSPDKLIPVSEASLSMLSSGPAKLTQNRLFKKAGEAGIYMNISDTTSVPLPSFDYIMAFGQYDSDVAIVDTTTLNRYVPQGSVSSLAGNNTYGLYFLYSPNGYRYYFGDDVFKAWGVNKQTTPTYEDKIGARNNLHPATLFARTQSGAIYYGSGGSKHLITNYNAFVRLGGTPYNTMSVLDDFVSAVPNGNDIN